MFFPFEERKYLVIEFIQMGDKLSRNTDILPNKKIKI